MADLQGDIEGYESGRYYGSDGKFSPFHSDKGGKFDEILSRHEI
jgi:hypothetical protein